MKISLERQVPVDLWGEQMRAAGYGPQWQVGTWRELPRELVKEMVSSGMPLSMNVDGMPESGRQGPDSPPVIEMGEDEVFSQLVEQYAREEKILVARKGGRQNESYTNGERRVQFDAAGFSPTWQQTEVREIPVSLYKMLIANDEGFTTNPDEIAEFLTMNQRRFTTVEDEKRAQREQGRIERARLAQQTQRAEGVIESAKNKLQKALKLSDAELGALFG